ncbi:MAG: hypothetical protein ACFFAO_07080, partial [Candidatus Hermodarchaeota archaeon]
MLNGLFIIQSETGILLYEKTFVEEMNDENLEMFRSFLTAIKQFISEMHFHGSKELKSINIGNNYVKIAHIPEVSSDIILLIDMEDEKTINKLIMPLIDIIIKHKELFLDLEQTAEYFKKCDQEINQLILSGKKILDDKVIENKEKFFKSIWEQKGAISIKLRDNLIIEMDQLINHLKTEQNLIKKSLLFEKLINILTKLDNKNELNKVQNEAKILYDEIKDRIIKLNYYLRETKEALREKKYRDAYINLYSFSSKLENLANTHV